MITLQGISASTGTAIGPFYVMPTALPKPNLSASLLTPAEEIGNLRRAAKIIADQLLERAERTSGEAQEILYASSDIAQDSALISAAESLILKGSTAAYAIWEASEVFAQLLIEAGGYLAERASDVSNIRDRIACVLMQVDYPEIPHLDYPFILIARDLSPADTIDLSAGQVLAIITEGGGPTSHTAIIARTLGIPAIVACPGALRAALEHGSGEKIGVDARTGSVHFSPSADLEIELAAVTATIQIRRATQAVRSGGFYATTDGVPISIYANVGRVDDVANAVSAGADGIGLLRTELLYLDRQTPPTISEQCDIYSAMFAPFRRRKVVIRTLDAGADKPMAFINFSHEPNPALGIRGYRTIGINENLLRDQLAAIAQAEIASGAEVWVMAPMITLLEEAEAFVSLAKSYGLKTVGVMIEVPSAVMMADAITKVVDFVSIGTNDLGQYLHAADRESADLAHFNDPWQPALLHAVHQIAVAGRKNDCSVGVCGEAASDPALAAVLIGLGVTSLSCNVGAIKDVAIAITSFSYDAMVSAADAALLATTAQSAKRVARAKLQSLTTLGL